MHHGYSIITNEVENSEEIKDKEKKDFSVKRIEMFKNKLGYSIIKNLDDLRYERNCPPFHSDEDMQKSQFDYLLGFKVLNQYQNVICFNSLGISKSDYETLYWSIRYLERKTFDQSEILKLRPVSNFISNLHSSNSELLKYY